LARATFDRQASSKSRLTGETFRVSRSIYRIQERGKRERGKRERGKEERGKEERERKEGAGDRGGGKSEK